MLIVNALLIGALGGLINRIRGGFLKERFFYNSTQLLRLFWSVCFATLVFLSLVPLNVIPYLELGISKWFILAALGFASWSLFGSGAHQEMNFNTWKDAWARNEHPHATEIFTEFWLPKVFGGEPEFHWPDWEFYAYHIIGKSTEGILRNFICLLPLCISNTGTFLIFVGTGLLWGPMYWVACHMPQEWPLKNSQLGEVMVGFVSFATLYICLN